MSAAPSLFPTMPQNGGSAPLLQFKAGKCKMEAKTDTPNKYTISPDTRKGTISLTRAADGVLHFRWLDRSDNNKVIDDYAIVPKETSFTRVNTGNEADRVYILKWKPTTPAAGVVAPAPTSGAATAQPGRRYMFWMQQKDSSVDTEHVTKVNELLNQPAPAVSTAQQQFMQMMGLAPSGAAAPAVAPAPAAATSAASTLNLDNMDFASLLSGIALPTAPTPATGNATAATATATAPPAVPTPASATATAPRVSLYDQLKSDVIISSGIFEDEAIRTRLLSYLPAESAAAATTPEAQATLLRETIHSPQFQQAVEVLSDALLEGSNYTSILSSFGIDPSPGMAKLMVGDAIGAFVDCIAAEAAKRKAASAAATTSSSTDNP